ELEYAVGHVRLLQLFFDAKASRREELELERRSRLVVLKNPHSELRHYLPQLHADLDELLTQFTAGQARLAAAIADEAKHQEDTLLRAMCCVRDSDASSTVLLHPTLHSGRIHDGLWAKLTAKQRAAAHVTHLTTLQQTHKQMLATLAEELDCEQSLEHARLMDRVRKRRAVRGIPHQHHKSGAASGDESNDDAADEKKVVLAEQEAVLAQVEAAAAKKATDATVAALAAEAVTIGLSDGGVSTPEVPSGPTSRHLPTDDAFGMLVKRMAETDVARVQCSISQVHAIEKVLLQMRARVKDTAKSSGSGNPKHVVGGKRKKPAVAFR
ncbi:hypothetical protein DYB31_014103, partial [Aphanomyces astaci]